MLSVLKLKHAVMIYVQLFKAVEFISECLSDRPERCVTAAKFAGVNVEADAATSSSKGNFCLESSWG